MRLFYRFGLTLLLAACCPLLLPKSAFCFDGTLKIGTGSEQGVYYAVGRTLAKMANKYGMLPKVTFAAVPSRGSVDNINGLAEGRFHFIIAQADRVHQAWNGEGLWAKKGKQLKLRTVANLYNESITLLVGEDTGIKNIKDIKGKKISLGGEGSGTRQNVLDVLKVNKINLSRLGADLTFGPKESAQRIESGQLDGFFYTVGHPCPFYKKLFAGKRKLRLVGLPSCRTLSDVYPYYVSSWIPLETYRKAANQGIEVRTCGVTAALLVNKDIPAPWVYRFIHAIAFHFEEFQKSHPVLRKVDKKRFEGTNWKISVPYHPGAKKFFQELGVGKAN